MKNLGDPIKSPADNKSYRTLELENGVRVLLISKPTKDGEQEPSAASMVVEAGSFHEPRGIAGLAHFCEHLLFMGTEKYPDENHFEEFIGRFGGYSNASTHESFTRYHFEMMEKNQFKQALDVWAQFFISPLMKENTVQREINAVDSEFDLARQDDWCRKLFIMQNAMMEEGHPCQQNGWGNTKLILENPKSKGIDSYEVLKQWYPDHYSSKWMKLCLQSPLPLDELENYAKSIFNAIPAREGLSEPKTNPFLTKTTGYLPVEAPQLVKYVPINDEITLDFWFTLPSVMMDFDSSPQSIPSYLIGHEGAGSILEKLKSEGLATELGIDSGDHTKLYTRVEISIRLTEAGFQKWEYVYQTVFAYIDLIKKMSDDDLKRIFEEVRNIKLSEWNCKEERTATRNVTQLSERMTYFPVNKWLIGRSLIEEFSPEKIRAYMETLTHANCITYLSSKKFETLELQTEQLSSAKYVIENMPASALQFSDDNKNGLSLPSINQYIANNFTLKDGEEKNWEYPQKIEATENGELWFKGDNKFNLPRAKVRFNFRHPGSMKQSLMHLYNKILCLKIAKKVYEAEAAGLNYSIDGDFAPSSNNIELGDNLDLTVWGVNQKLTVLLDELLNEIENLKVTETEFYDSKKEQLEDYNNCLIKPKNLAIDLFSQLALKNYSSLSKMTSDLVNLTYADFESERATIWSQCYCQCHVEGNFTKEEAKDIFSKTVNRLQCSGKSDLITIPEVKMVSEPTCVKVENFNKTDGNSYVISHYQYGEATLEEKARMELMGYLTSDMAFDFLRTKNTLGYVCFSMVPQVRDYYSFALIVGSQRDRFSVEDVYQKMNEFHDHFLTKMKEMSEGDYQNFRNSLVQSLTKAPTNLGSVFASNDSRIFDGKYDFDRRLKKAAIVPNIKKDEIISIYESKVKNNSAHIMVAVEGIEESKRSESQILELKNMTLNENKTFKQINSFEELQSAL